MLCHLPYHHIRKVIRTGGSSVISKRCFVNLKSSTGISKDVLFKALQLESFTQPEIKLSYDRLLLESTTNGNINMENGLRQMLVSGNANVTAQEVDKHIGSLMHTLLADDKANTNDKVISLFAYESNVLKLANELDQRIWPMAASFAFAGVSIGIIIPCMPLVVQTLQLPLYQFGFVVSAFGLSKLLGNIPTGYLITRFGRIPVLVGGLATCGVGIAGLGLALIPNFGLPWLVACRFATGIGLSAFLGGAFTYMTDISTSVNRTRTMAPVMASFQAGTALGPALGGVMIEAIGLAKCYYSVGLMITSLTALNLRILTETGQIAKKKVMVENDNDNDNNHNNQLKTHLEEPKNNSSSITSDSSDKKHYHTGSVDHNKLFVPPQSTVGIARDDDKRQSVLAGMTEATAAASEAWTRLWKIRSVRGTVVLNGVYWMALAGTQMTLLPMLMISDTLQLTASSIGSAFALMSVVSVASSQAAAYLSDKYGKENMMIVGTSLISTSMLGISLTSSYPELLCALVPLAMGTTTLSAAPPAHISDIVEPIDRPQALSLLRTAGDVGLLVGGMCAGLFADFSTIQTAIQANSAIMLGAASIFAIRHRKWRI